MRHEPAEADDGDRGVGGEQASQAADEHDEAGESFCHGSDLADGQGLSTREGAHAPGRDAVLGL
jgi:hypothetical protein